MVKKLSDVPKVLVLRKRVHAVIDSMQVKIYERFTIHEMKGDIEQNKRHLQHKNYIAIDMNSKVHNSDKNLEHIVFIIDKIRRYVTS